MFKFGGLFILKSLRYIILFIFILVIFGVFLIFFDLGFPMSNSAAKKFYNTNKDILDEVVTIDQKTGILEYLKIGKTFDNRYRIKFLNNPTKLYEDCEPKDIKKKLDSLNIEIQYFEKICDIVSRLDLVAIQKDKYAITFGLREFGFDSRSSIKYCFNNNCPGNRLDIGVFFINAKPIW